MIEALLAKLELRDSLKADERAALAESFNPPKPFRLHDTLVHQGSSPDESTLLLEGLTARLTTVRDGGQQITALHIPGDFVDLHSFLVRKMDHSIVALTDGVTATVSHARLRELTERFPHLARMLWQSTLIDAAIHRQWLVAMGRMSALGQLAHLLCEHALRLSAVGLGSEQAFDFRVTQANLGDVLGLSAVHVNRTLQELRARNLISWTGSHVEILDRAGLAELGEFDPTYLQLGRTPV